MAQKATFVHGNPVMVDHTPSSAIAAGDTVLVGDEPRVAHNAIAANALGTLAAGGGVYDVDKETTNPIADGVVLYFDNSAKKVTPDGPGSHKIWGRSVKAALAADTKVRALHDPSANAS